MNTCQSKKEAQMSKLKMLKPRVKMLDTSRGLTMIGDLQRAARRKAKATGRDADPNRVLPLTGAAWRKLRAQVLQGEPLCRHCAAIGLVVVATDVDHMHGADDNRLESLQPLCHPCHSIKTAADQGKRIKPAIGLDGFPLTGDWSKQP